MQIDPRSLIQLAEIIEQQSFSLAATRLRTTQPALSKMIATLEKRLGAKLLAQRRRPVLPTELGRQLAETGQAIRAALAGASILAAGNGKGEVGQLRVGAPPFICDSLLPALIQTFRITHPGISFDVVPAYLDELRQLVHQNRLDIAFGPVSLQLDRLELVTSELVSLCHAVVCRAGNPILERRNATAQDFERADWISHAKESALHGIMRNCLSAVRVSRINPSVTSSASGTVISLLRTGDSLTVLPVFSVLEQLDAGVLALVPFPVQPDEVLLGAITRDAIVRRHVIDQFKQHVAEGFRASEARARAALAQLDQR